MLNLFKFTMITLIVIIDLVLFGHLFLEHNSSLHLIQLQLSCHWILALWRYVIYASVFFMWPYFIKKIGACQDWEPPEIEYFLNQRLNLLILFILVEVLFVYNLLGHFLSWM